MAYLINRSNRHVTCREVAATKFHSFSQSNKQKNISHDGTTFVLYISVNIENVVTIEMGLKRDIVDLNVVSCTFPPKYPSIWYYQMTAVQ